jgi:HlyD family secretion protein
MLAAWLAAMGLIHVDRVVTAPGLVVSTIPSIVVQPLERAIVRTIDVREGQRVRSGDLLARLDATFAAADAGALEDRVASLQSEVSRLQSELDGQPVQYSGTDSWMSLQASIARQREEERSSKLEAFGRKIEALKSTAARASGDAKAYAARLALAQQVESMRKELEQLQAGSKLNSLIATDSRLEIERSLSTAVKQQETAAAELASMTAERDAYERDWRVQTALKLTEQTRALNDAREQFKKARLRRRLVELRADRDATVLTIARVAEGSILQPGDQLITLVPTGAALEVEADISARDNGFVKVGDAVAIKFDTFPFALYGMADGAVRTLSPDSFASADQRIGRTPGAMRALESPTAPFYRSRITIERVELHDVPANFHLVPGMPVTTDIRVGRQTVLSYLLGRVLPVVSEGMREP